MVSEGEFEGKADENDKRLHENTTPNEVARQERRLIIDYYNPAVQAVFFAVSAN